MEKAATSALRFLLLLLTLGEAWGATAQYVGTDTTTQGNWEAAYGIDGQEVIDAIDNPPAYATITPSGNANYTWASSVNDVRALSLGPGNPNGIAAVWYSSPGFSIDLNLSDALTHRISLYLLDWDGMGRAEQIQISDANSMAVLDTQNFGSFGSGVYASWNVQGHVTITFTQTGGSNAVVDGIFFDTPSVTNIWNGSTSDDWNVAANWSLNQVPDGSHDVQIGNGAGAASTVPSLTAPGGTCHSLTFSGTASTLGAGGGTLTVGVIGVSANVSGSTIACPVALGVNQAWNIAAGNTLTVSGAIAGAFALAKNGTGVLTLSGANTYTGATTINAGTVSVAALADGGSASGIGASANAAANLVLNGGTLQYTGGATSSDRLFSVGTSGGTIDASGTGAVNLTNAGSMDFNGQNGARSVTLTGTSTAANTIAAVIADQGGATSVSKNAAGTWLLSGANGFSGGTTINLGTLDAGGHALGNGLVTVAAAATLSVSGSSGLAGRYYNVAASLPNFYTLEQLQTHLAGQTLALGDTAPTLDFALNGSGFPAPYSSGAGNFESLYTGRLTIAIAGVYTFNTTSDDGSMLWIDGVQVVYANFTQANATRTGAIALSAGVHDIAVGYWQGGGGYGLNAQISGPGDTTMVDLSVGNATLAPDLMIGSLAGAGAVALTTGNLVVGLDGTSTTFSGAISGSGGVRKIGTGTLTLSGASTYAGATNVTLGTLKMGADGALPSSSTMVDNAVLDLGGHALTIGSLVGNGTIDTTASGTSTLTIGQGGGSSTFTGIIANTAGTLALAKSGAGTIALTANSTYGGGTTIAQGTLNAGGSALGSGRVTVTAGATLGVAGAAGLSARYYNVTPDSNNFTSLSQLQTHLAGQTVVLANTAATLNFANDGTGFPPPDNFSASNFEAIYLGRLLITVAGTYTFNTSSDDGSMLWVDGTQVVNNNFSQAVVTRSGTIALTTGYHDIAVGYWQGGGGYGMNAQISGAGDTTMVDLSTANAAIEAIAPTLSIGSLAGAGSVLLSTGDLIVGLDGTSSSFTGVISDGTVVPGAVTKVGAGTLSLASACTYAGTTTVSAGVLSLTNNTLLSSTVVNIASGAVLEYDVAGNITQPTLTLSGAGTVRKIGAGAITFGGGGVINWNLGAGSLIDVQQGALIGGANVQDVWTTNLSSLNIASGAAFFGVEANVRVDALTGSGAFLGGYPGAGYVCDTIGVNNGTGSFSGTTSDHVASLVLVKVGTGTQTLTGSCAHTGATTVTAGTLRVDSGGSLIGTQSLIIQSGGAFILGTGTVTLASDPTGVFGVGYGANGSGSVTVLAGGALNIGNGGGRTFIGGGPPGGPFGTGTMTISGGTVTAGAAGTNPNNNIWMGGYGSTGTLNLDGGTLITQRQIHDGGSQQSTINLNGGTLRTDIDGEFFTYCATVNVRNGGAIIDSDGHAPDLIRPLIHSVIGGDNASDGGLTKLGLGTLTLAANNAFTGPVVVNAGALRTTTPNSLTGAIGAASGLTINNGGTVSAEGDYNSLVGAATSGSKTIRINAGGRLVSPGSFTHHLHAVLLDGGSMSAYAPNPDWGNWNFDFGLATAGDGSVSIIEGGNAAMTQSGGTVFAIGAGDTLCMSTVLAATNGAGDTGLIKSGPGVLVLGATETYASATTISGGILRLSNPPALVNGNFESPALSADSYLYYGTMSPSELASFAWTNSGGINGGALANNSGAWGYVAPYADGNQAFSLQETTSMSQTLNFLPGTYSITWWHARRVAEINPYYFQVDGVSQGAAYTAPSTAWSSMTTTFTIASAGMHTIGFLGTAVTDFSVAIDRVSLNGGGRLPSTTAVTISASGAALDVDDCPQTIASLTGVSGSSVTLGSGALTVGDGSTTTFAGVLSDAGGSSPHAGGSLTKAGSGALTLSGANTLTGTTTVNAGTLSLTGSIAGAATVSGGTLNGTGTVSGNVAVGASGSVAPGVGGAGKLSLGGTCTALGTVNVELGGTTQQSGYDWLAVGGAATLAGSTITVTTINGFAPAVGSYFDVLTAHDITDADLSAVTFDFSAAPLGTGPWVPSIVSLGGGAEALRLSVVSQSPVISPNTGLTLAAGTTATIATTQLAATDADNTASQLIFTVTTAPSHGMLRRNLVALAVNDTFTQADIAGNLLSYEHGDLASLSDSFVVTLSDGTTTTAPTTVTITCTGSGLSTGLTLWWPLDDAAGTVARDASGNGYHGTFAGANFSWGTGQVGGDVLFGAGNPDTYIITDGLTWTPAAFSVCWRLRPHALIDYNQMIGDTAGWNQTFLAHSTATGGIYAGTINDESTGRFNPTDLPAQLALNTWASCALVNPGTVTASTFYRDGVARATKVLSYPHQAWSGFQASTANASFSLDGAIDDVRIYGRALTAEEAAAINAASSDAAPVLGSVAAAATFIKGGGAVAVDSGAAATVSDADDLCLSGGQLLVEITNLALAEDVLSVASGVNGITVAGSVVSSGGQRIGAIDGTINGSGTGLLVRFDTRYATPAAAQALVRSLRYTNTNASSPTLILRSIRLAVSDGLQLSAPVTVTMACTPVILARETQDSDHNGRIDRIRIVTDIPLNDNFTGLSATVAGYAVTGFSSGTANDTEFFIQLTEGASADTDATPVVRITANTTLGGQSGNALLATDAGTAAVDTAAPVLIGAAWSDGGAVGTSAGDTLTLTFSESVAATSLVVSDLGLPVTADSLSSTTISDQSGSTLTMTLAGTPRLSAGGSYSSAALASGKPSGIFLASATHLADLATAPNAGFVGTAASAVDIVATPSSLIRIEWDDTHDIIAKTWALGALDLGAVSTSPTYPIRNAGSSTVSLSLSCTDSAVWTVQATAGSDSFAMRANVDGNPDFELGLSTGATPVPGPLVSGDLQDLGLQFAAPTASITGASQSITVTVTATQF